LISGCVGSIDYFAQRIGHPRREWKLEFKQGRCPPLDVLPCSVFFMITYARIASIGRIAALQSQPQIESLQYVLRYLRAESIVPSSSCSQADLQNQEQVPIIPRPTVAPKPKQAIRLADLLGLSAPPLECLKKGSRWS